MLSKRTMECIQCIFVLLAALTAIHYSGQGPHLMRKLNEFATGKKGCSPVADLDFVTLHYFAGRGRGEAIRLMLQEAGIPYNQTDFTKETWPQAKAEGIKSGLFTFGQVPAMSTPSGIQMVQSQAIAHYIGRATGMECDCEQLSHCEVIALGVEDFHSKLAKTIYDPDFSVAMRDEYIQTTAPMWLQHFEKIAPNIQAEDAAYFGGKHITWIDFLIYDLLDSNVEFARVDMGRPLVSILDQYPKLLSFYNQFRARPRIVAYLNSDKRAAYKLPKVPVVQKLQAAKDFHSKLAKTIYDPDFSVAMRDEYIQTTAPMWLQHFEKIAPNIQAEDAAYFGGKHITWIDFLIYDLLDSNVEFARVDMGRPLVSILDQYPKLLSFYNQFRARPRIVAYLNSDKRAAYKLPKVPVVQKLQAASKKI